MGGWTQVFIESQHEPPHHHHHLVGTLLAVCDLMWNHFVARTCTPLEPFQDFKFARWFWIKLVTLFPDTISAVAMPNHIHLILPQSSPHAFAKFTGLLGAASKKLAQEQLWQGSPKPTEIPDRFHLSRQLRYVALNPCRKNLCQDPMEWYWSTYREIIGAALTHKQEQLLANLQLALNDFRPNFRVRFHHYVSADPSVCVTGTPFPKPSAPKDLPKEPILNVLAAAAAVLRLTPSHVLQRHGPLRPLFIHAAYRHGWGQPKMLASICGIKQNSVHWLLQNHEVPAGLLTGVDLCLGDARLRGLVHTV